MARPPPIPRKGISPTASLSSILSQRSSATSQSSEEPGGSSVLLRELHDSFQPANVFSQFEDPKGRGQNAILQTLGLLHQIWSNRDPEDPSSCFDRNDGRCGLKIYRAPKRGPGGVVIPCSLICEMKPGSDDRQMVNIVNNNVFITSSGVAPDEARMKSSGRGNEFSEDLPKLKSTRRVQLTFKKSKNQFKNPKPPFRKRENSGRFSRKHIVPVDDKRNIAPSIPMRVKGLRRLLKQFVVGDPERSLTIPLGHFSMEQRNGRDCNGKKNKQIYSRRRKVALAALLALQDAVENKISFAAAIGLSNTDEQDLNDVRMTEWEKIASAFLQRSSRSMGDKDLIDLGQKMYRKEYIELLPKCEN